MTHKGPKGDKGERGDQGLKGDKGYKGDVGPQGPKGDVGPRGLKGDKSDCGSTGRQGLCGNPSPQGPQGHLGSGGGGLQGPKGDRGYTGPQGLKGDKGDRGSKGAKGDSSPRGPKGSDGAAGKLTRVTDDLSMNGHRVTQLSAPQWKGDTTNKVYMDSLPKDISRATVDSLYLGLSGGTLQGGVHFLNASRITNLGNPQVATDAANKRSGRGLTQTMADARYLKLSGGNLRGALSMGTNKVTDLADSTEDTDATNIAWVRTHTTGCYLSKGGGVLTCDLSMSNMRITSLGGPVGNSDAVSKEYVDSKDSLMQLKSERISYSDLGNFFKGLIHAPMILKVIGSPDSPTTTIGDSSLVQGVVFRKVGNNKLHFVLCEVPRTRVVSFYKTLVL